MKEKTPTKKESERKKSDGGGRGGDGKKDNDEKKKSVGGGSGGGGGKDRDEEKRRSTGDSGAMVMGQADRLLGLSESDVWLEKPRYEAAEVHLAAALARIAESKNE